MLLASSLFCCIQHSILTGGFLSGLCDFRQYGKYFKNLEGKGRGLGKAAATSCKNACASRAGRGALPPRKDCHFMKILRMYLLFAQNVKIRAGKMPDKYRRPLEKARYSKNSRGGDGNGTAAQPCEMGICRWERGKRPFLWLGNCVKKVKNMKTRIKPRC